MEVGSVPGEPPGPELAASPPLSTASAQVLYLPLSASKRRRHRRPLTARASSKDARPSRRGRKGARRKRRLAALSAPKKEKAAVPPALPPLPPPPHIAEDVSPTAPPPHLDTPRIRPTEEARARQPKQRKRKSPPSFFTLATLLAILSLSYFARPWKAAEPRKRHPKRRRSPRELRAQAGHKWSPGQVAVLLCLVVLFIYIMPAAFLLICLRPRLATGDSPKPRQSAKLKQERPEKKTKLKDPEGSKTDGPSDRDKEPEDPEDSTTDGLKDLEKKKSDNIEESKSDGSANTDTTPEDPESGKDPVPRVSLWQRLCNRVRSARHRSTAHFHFVLSWLPCGFALTCILGFLFAKGRVLYRGTRTVSLTSVIWKRDFSTVVRIRKIYDLPLLRGGGIGNMEARPPVPGTPMDQDDFELWWELEQLVAKPRVHHLHVAQLVQTLTASRPHLARRLRLCQGGVVAYYRAKGQDTTDLLMATQRPNPGSAARKPVGLGLAVRLADADGDCLASALAISTSYAFGDATNIRRFVADYMEEQPRGSVARNAFETDLAALNAVRERQRLPALSYAAWTRSLRRHAFEAGSEMLRAFAAVTGLCVLVHECFGGRWKTLEFGSPDAQTVHLRFRRSELSGHFDALLHHNEPIVPAFVPDAARPRPETSPIATRQELVEALVAAGNGRMLYTDDAETRAVTARMTPDLVSLVKSKRGLVPFLATRDFRCSLADGERPACDPIEPIRLGRPAPLIPAALEPVDWTVFAHTPDSEPSRLEPKRKRTPPPPRTPPTDSSTTSESETEFEGEEPSSPVKTLRERFLDSWLPAAPSSRLPPLHSTRRTKLKLPKHCFVCNGPFADCQQFCRKLEKSAKKGTSEASFMAEAKERRETAAWVKEKTRLLNRPRGSAVPAALARRRKAAAKLTSELWDTIRPVADVSEVPAEQPANDYWDSQHSVAPEKEPKPDCSPVPAALNLRRRAAALVWDVLRPLADVAEVPPPPLEPRQAKKTTKPDMPSEKEGETQKVVIKSVGLGEPSEGVGAGAAVIAAAGAGPPPPPGPPGPPSPSKYYTPPSTPTKKSPFLRCIHFHVFICQNGSATMRTPLADTRWCAYLWSWDGEAEDSQLARIAALFRPFTGGITGVAFARDQLSGQPLADPGVVFLHVMDDSLLADLNVARRLEERIRRRRRRIPVRKAQRLAAGADPAPPIPNGGCWYYVLLKGLLAGETVADVVAALRSHGVEVAEDDSDRPLVEMRTVGGGLEARVALRSVTDEREILRHYRNPTTNIKKWTAQRSYEPMEKDWRDAQINFSKLGWTLTPFRNLKLKLDKKCNKFHASAHVAKKGCSKKQFLSAEQGMENKDCLAAAVNNLMNQVRAHFDDPKAEHAKAAAAAPASAPPPLPPANFPHFNTYGIVGRVTKPGDDVEVKKGDRKMRSLLDSTATLRNTAKRSLAGLQTQNEESMKRLKDALESESERTLTSIAVAKALAGQQLTEFLGSPRNEAAVGNIADAAHNYTGIRMAAALISGQHRLHTDVANVLRTALMEVEDGSGGFDVRPAPNAPNAPSQAAFAANAQSALATAAAAAVVAPPVPAAQGPAPVPAAQPAAVAQAPAHAAAPAPAAIPAPPLPVPKARVLAPRPRFVTRPMADGPAVLGQRLTIKAKTKHTTRVVYYVGGKAHYDHAGANYVCTRDGVDTLVIPALTADMVGNGSLVIYNDDFTDIADFSIVLQTPPPAPSAALWLGATIRTGVDAVKLALGWGSLGEEGLPPPKPRFDNTCSVDGLGEVLGLEELGNPGFLAPYIAAATGPRADFLNGIMEMIYGSPARPVGAYAHPDHWANENALRGLAKMRHAAADSLSVPGKERRDLMAQLDERLDALFPPEERQVSQRLFCPKCPPSQLCEPIDQLLLHFGGGDADIAEKKGTWTSEIVSRPTETKCSCGSPMWTGSLVWTKGSPPVLYPVDIIPDWAATHVEPKRNEDDGALVEDAYNHGTVTRAQLRHLLDTVFSALHIGRRNYRLAGINCHSGEKKHFTTLLKVAGVPAKWALYDGLCNPPNNRVRVFDPNLDHEVDAIVDYLNAGGYLPEQAVYLVGGEVGEAAEAEAQTAEPHGPKVAFGSPPAESESRARVAFDDLRQKAVVETSMDPLKVLRVTSDGGTSEQPFVLPSDVTPEKDTHVHEYIFRNCSPSLFMSVAAVPSDPHWDVSFQGSLVDRMVVEPNNEGWVTVTRRPHALPQPSAAHPYITIYTVMEDAKEAALAVTASDMTSGTRNDVCDHVINLHDNAGLPPILPATPFAARQAGVANAQLVGAAPQPSPAQRFPPQPTPLGGVLPPATVLRRKSHEELKAGRVLLAGRVFDRSAARPWTDFTHNCDESPAMPCFPADAALNDRLFVAADGVGLYDVLADAVLHPVDQYLRTLRTPGVPSEDPDEPYQSDWLDDHVGPRQTAALDVGGVILSRLHTTPAEIRANVMPPQARIRQQEPAVFSLVFRAVMRAVSLLTAAWADEPGTQPRTLALPLLGFGKALEMFKMKPLKGDQEVEAWERTDEEKALTQDELVAGLFSALRQSLATQPLLGSVVVVVHGEEDRNRVARVGQAAFPMPGNDKPLLGGLCYLGVEEWGFWEGEEAAVAVSVDAIGSRVAYTFVPCAALSVESPSGVAVPGAFTSMPRIVMPAGTPHGDYTVVVRVRAVEGRKDEEALAALADQEDPLNYETVIDIYVMERMQN